MLNWSRVRAEFPVLDDRVYLNTGTYGPIPRCAVDAETAQARDEARMGRACSRYYEQIDAVRAHTRGALARLLGVEASDVTLTSSTTTGCHLVTTGLRLGPGDEIVTTSLEHHSFLTALRATRAELVVVDVGGLDDDAFVSRLRAAVNERTRLIALSQITWAAGRRLPVERLTSLAAPLLVDAAQSVGVLPVDAGALGCEFLIFPGQKWLLGPEATGGLYVRPDWQARLSVALPSSYGHAPFAGQTIDEPLADARRFTQSPVGLPALAAFNAALDFAAELGPERFARAQRLAGELHHALASRYELAGPLESTLVSFAPAPGRDAEDLCAHLTHEQIVTRTVPGTNWLRCCVGFWNDERDLERLLDALERFDHLTSKAQ